MVHKINIITYIKKIYIILYKINEKSQKQMISHNQFKLIRALNLKKHREEHNLFVAEGQKIILELLQCKTCKIHSLFLTDAAKRWLERYSEFELKSNIVSQSELERISFLKTPSFGLAVVEKPTVAQYEVSETNQIVLMLDAIRDPGNLGTIIRVADWFGINSIVCSEDTVDAYSPKVIQATMGSFLRTNIYYCNLKEYLEQTPKNTHIYGSFMQGQPLNTIDPQIPAVIIVGNESIGISESLRPFISEKICIPGEKNYQNNPDSLNAAVATSIIVYHFMNNVK
jgi:TrmH family RNA methyltransferase